MKLDGSNKKLNSLFSNNITFQIELFELTLYYSLTEIDYAAIENPT